VKGVKFGSFFLHLQAFLLPFQNFFKFPKKLFDHLRKLTDITPPKLLLDVDFRKSKYMISGSQNISPELDFRKSKYITRSRLPKVKIYHQKSTSGSQNISPEVHFRKSKIITKSRLLEVKKLILF